MMNNKELYKTTVEKIEETELKLSHLEKKVLKAEKVIYEEKCLDLVSNAADNGIIKKNFYFNSKNGDGGVFYVKFDSNYASAINFTLHVNGKEVLKTSMLAPIEIKHCFIAQKGYNVIGVSLDVGGGVFRGDLYMKIEGYYEMKLTDHEINDMGYQYYSYRQGDTLRVINEETNTTLLCVYGVEQASSCHMQYNYIAVLFKTVDGKFKSRKYELSGRLYFDRDIDPFSKGVVVVRMGVMIFYVLKSNDLYEIRYVAKDDDFSCKKLQMRAKDVNCFIGKNHYLCYTDMRNNAKIFAVGTNSNLNISSSYSYSLVDCVKVYHYGTEPRVIYKLGLVLVDQNMNNSTDRFIVGEGDEAIHLRSGTVIIRRGDELVVIPTSI